MPYGYARRKRVNRCHYRLVIFCLMTTEKKILINHDFTYIWWHFMLWLPSKSRLIVLYIILFFAQLELLLLLFFLVSKNIFNCFLSCLPLSNSNNFRIEFFQKPIPFMMFVHILLTPLLCDAKFPFLIKSVNVGLRNLNIILVYKKSEWTLPKYQSINRINWYLPDSLLFTRHVNFNASP